MVIRIEAVGIYDLYLHQLLLPSAPLFLTSVFSSFVSCQLGGSESGDAVSPGDRPVSRITADAVGAAGARLPARFSWKLLAEPARAVRLGLGPPQDHPEART